MHCFELKTTNLEYYVGGDKINSAIEMNDESTNNSVEPKREKSWEDIIQHALMPVPSNPASKYSFCYLPYFFWSLINNLNSLKC